MKCFTINETAKPGIDIVHPEGMEDPCILVGDLTAGYSPFPLSSDICSTLKRRSEFIHGVSERCSAIAREDNATNHQKLLAFMQANDGRTTEQNYVKLALVWLDEFEDVNRLFKADVSTNEPVRITRERNPRSDMALVLVDTQTIDGGELWFEANSYHEEVARQGRRERVVRVYHEFPAAGVDVLAMGTADNGELRVLCTMKPGSSFRIVRSGVSRDTSPVLIVAWPGSKLKVFPPKKYKSAMVA